MIIDYYQARFSLSLLVWPYLDVNCSNHVFLHFNLDTHLITTISTIEDRRKTGSAGRQYFIISNIVYTPTVFYHSIEAQSTA